MRRRRIGIVGGKFEKSWLLYRALACHNCGAELAAGSKVLFGSPPLIARQLHDGQLDAVGLAAAADLHPEEASFGMQRRVAMARALAVAPSLIFMDEPLVSPDAASSARVQAVMVAVLDRSGASCLIATHDHGQALAVADRLLELGDSPARLVSDRHSPLLPQ